NVAFPNAAPKVVSVVGPDGQQVPAQVIGAQNGTTQILFLAKTPSVGYAVFDVQAADSQTASATLKVSESTLENGRYRISIDPGGDVSAILDKKLNRELLSAPIRMAIKTDKPTQWPAWNMDWNDQIKAPRAYVGGPAKIRVSENGPVRVAVEVVRETEGSKYQ